MSGRQAVFLDKDGTIVEDVPFNADPGLIRLAVGAAGALKSMHNHGYALVVVSNQPGVARGFFPFEALRGVAAAIERLTEVAFEGFYWCPHDPEGSIPEYAHACRCRKPEPGLLLKAAEDLHIDLQRSWCVGDILNDVEAGNRAGCRTILLDNGNETEWQWSDKRQPAFVTGTLASAASIIIDRHGVAR